MKIKITKLQKVIYACGHWTVIGILQIPKIECGFCHSPVVSVEIEEEQKVVENG